MSFTVTSKPCVSVRGSQVSGALTVHQSLSIVFAATDIAATQPNAKNSLFIFSSLENTQTLRNTFFS